MYPQLNSVRPIVALGTLVASALLATSSITIEAGDSLSEIAERHGVTVDQLVEWNDLADPDRIISGRTLIVAAPSDTPAVATTDGRHVVTAGDTLSALAGRFGTTIARIAADNSLADPDRIYIGQRLTIGGSATAPSPTTTAPAPTTTTTPARTHTVVAGDTLSTIAEQFGVKTGQLAADNGITNPDRIRIGMVLTIGAAAPAPTVTTPTTVAPTPTPTTPTVPAPATPAPTSTRSGGEVLLVPMFANWSSVYGVPQDLLEAIAWQRSNWQPNTVGSDGRLGITQLTPATVELVESALLGRDLDPLAAQDGVQMGARYLRYLIDRAGSEDAAVAAWVQGLESVQTNGIDANGAAFVAAVEEIRQQRR